MNYVKNKGELILSNKYWLVSRESESDYYLDRIPLTPKGPIQIIIVSIDTTNSSKILIKLNKNDITRSIEIYSDPNCLLDRLFESEKDAIDYWNSIIDSEIEEYRRIYTNNVRRLTLEKLDYERY